MKLVVALFAVLLLGIVFAQTGTTPSEGLKANVMRMQYEKLVCRVDFYTHVLQYVKEQELNVSVDETIASLNMHKGELETAANDADRHAFNEVVRALREDVKEAARLYREAKTGNGREGAELRKTLKDFVDEEKRNRNDCLAETSKGLGEAQAAYVRAWIEDAKNTSEKLKAKGVDTSEMDEAIEDAKGSASELEEAVATENGTVVAETAKRIREEHLHIWARFQLARIEALLDALEERAAEKELSGNVEEIRALITDARAKVQEGVPYNEGEFQEVHDTVKEAAQKLRELFREIEEG